MDMSKIKAIIYDVDGTMVNSEPIHVGAWNKALLNYGYSLQNLSESFRQTMAGRKPVVIAEEMVNRLLLSVSSQQLLDTKSQIFLQIAQKDLKAMPGVLESVERFNRAGYKLGIGTSLDRSYLDHVLDKIDVSKFFDAIVTGDQITHGKPNPETYLKVAEKLGLTPMECLVIEDAETGIASAKAAGSICVAIMNSEALIQNTSGADFTLGSLDELTIELILSLG